MKNEKIMVNENKKELTQSNSKMFVKLPLEEFEEIIKREKDYQKCCEILKLREQQIQYLNAQIEEYNKKFAKEEKDEK